MSSTKRDRKAEELETILGREFEVGPEDEATFHVEYLPKTIKGRPATVARKLRRMAKTCERAARRCAALAVV